MADLVHRPWLKQHSNPNEMPSDLIVAQNAPCMDAELDWQPRKGNTFSTLEEAWKFWTDYGARSGFNVRKQYYNKNKNGRILTVRYVCSKEGIRRADKRDHLTVNPRLETRTNCPVKLGLKYMKDIEKYQIYDLCDEHNHPLHLPETSHMLISQRKLSQVQAHEIDLANDSGLKQKSTFELMSRQVGGRENLGYTRLDQKNYLRSKRLRNMAYGEAGSLLQYFQQESIENPSFYHAVQLDVEEQITNIFWADARMIMDYEYFGDVVTLDTTYSTNNAYRPLAVFAGFNHFRGVVIFGAALLYDETSESFEWLFREFLKAHKNKKPQTLFTDQDHAMAKALPQVMPETYHGLCSWHLMQNGIKHLGNLMKNGSHFLKDFSFCMYKCLGEADFQRAWDKLLDDYNLQDNKWLIGVYKVKEKWAKCYMKNTFTIGMQSTQLSESFNADLKTCMKPDLDIIQFFKHFERVVGDKRYNELQCEFDSRQKVPRLKMQNSPLLQQVAHLYTLPVFDLFQKGYDKYAACYIKKGKEGEVIHEYFVGLCNEDGEFKVSFTPSTSTVSCSCKKFETFGILCCHAIKVLDVKDIKSLPIQYILKRWTREANGFVKDTHGKHIQEDATLDSTQRYRQICPKLVRIATQASDCKEAYIFMEKAIEDLQKQVDEICKKNLGLENINVDLSSSFPNENHFLQVKGLKRRNGIKNWKKRPKSWVENQHKKTKKVSKISASQNKQMKENNDISSSHASDHGFNRLLMEPLHDTFFQSTSTQSEFNPLSIPLSDVSNLMSNQVWMEYQFL